MPPHASIGMRYKDIKIYKANIRHFKQGTLMEKICVVIPAYNPGKELVELISKLLSYELNIIVINDGSRKDTIHIFDQVKSLNDQIKILHHAINLGKGAALKTGLNHAHIYFKNIVGVVTADADGQHTADDIFLVGLSLIQNPKDLVIGVRKFEQQEIPFRSKFGNLLTINLFKIIMGRKLSDTQSGLRGIPLDFIPTLLKINNNGYEFELNMLIACKYTNRKICEVPIKTVYIENNHSSHFNPVLDSLKIYFVLFRFLILSFLTFLIDFSIFATFTYCGFNLITCQIASRSAGILFNYPIAKNMVFHSDNQNNYYFTKYISLVIANGVISYIIISYFITYYLFPQIGIKILVEAALFIANFAIEREFIFTRKVVYEN